MSASRKRLLPMSRRRFLTATVAAGFAGAIAPSFARRLGTRKPQGKLIFIALDGLHPGYLQLDSNGNPGGASGRNALMPNLRAFLAQSVSYPAAKCFLPSATDMNHLNALAGTSSGQTGVISVNSQFMGWDGAGAPVVKTIDLSWPRDVHGRPVDTLFHAWKRAFEGSKTAFVSGKGWVAEGYAASEKIVDFIVTGASRPSYVAAPARHDFCDPLSDADGRCDPESNEQNRGLSTIMQSITTQFPSDAWVAEASLTLLEKEDPDMMYILLAQSDDTGHALGAGWDPEEFVAPAKPYDLPLLCQSLPKYQQVSSRDQRLFREPMLDAIYEVDTQFGVLIDGLRQRGILDTATIMLFSDHSMITYLRENSATSSVDALELLTKAGLAGSDDFAVWGAASFAALYWREGRERSAEAKWLLEAHTAVNPQNGASECPWWILDRTDMKNGREGLCAPGELYHPWFIDADAEQTMRWPDLFLFAKNGWQIPAYSGLNNLGIGTLASADGLSARAVFMGGHGSVDTLPIVMAIRTPGATPAVINTDARIADLAVTAADIYELELRSVSFGTSRANDVASNARRRPAAAAHHSSANLIIAKSRDARAMEVTYRIPGDAHVTIDIHDVSGRRITRIVEADKNAGEHRAVLATSALRGVAFCRMEAIDARGRSFVVNRSLHI